MKYARYVKYIVIPFLVMIFLSLNPVTSLAKTGDFYEKHKTDFDTFVIDPEMKKLVEKYDYDTNSFKCGRIDFSCKINSTIFQMSLGSVKFSAKGLNFTVISPNDIIKDKDFSKYKKGLSVLSKSMMVIFLMWNMMKIIASRFADSSDGLIAFNDKILLMVVGTTLLTLYDKFVTFVLNIQQLAVDSVFKTAINEEELIKSIFIWGAGYGLIIALAITFILLIFAVAFMYRFVLFGLLYITGVIAIPTILNDEYNYFQIWLGHLINNGVTLFLQVLCFALGLNKLVTFGENPLIAAGFFILALSVPSLLGNLGASSGTARAGTEILRHATRRR